MKPKQHKKIGMAYTVVMGISLVAAVAMLTVRFNFFLLLVTVLSSDSLYTGYRTAKRKSRQQPTWYDWLALSITGAFASAFLVYGVMGVTGLGPLNIPTVFAYIGIGFALLLGSDVRGMFRYYKNPPKDRRAWLYLHGSRMMGSYVALVVAMCVTLSRYLLPMEIMWMAWTFPPIIGGMLIGRTLKRVRARYERPVAAVAAD